MDVKGVGEPSIFQNVESRFYEWAKKIQDTLIGIEPRLQVMLDWALANEIEVRQSIVADKFGENGDQIEQGDGNAQVVVRRKTVLAHLTEGESWSIVQICGRNGVEAWRCLHTRFGPSTGGRRRNLLRVIMASQRVKVEDLG